LPRTFDPSFAALAIGLVSATVIDVRSRRIPNLLTAAMAGAGLGLATAGLSGMTLMASVLGLVIGLALMLPGHLLGATGAGDVKLMAAVGSLIGPALIVNAFLFTAIAGGVLAVAVALRRRRLGATLDATARIVADPAAARHEIESAPATRRFAYGPAIAVGSVLAAVLR
jgi:prepilin peptidase CpaA